MAITDSLIGYWALDEASGDALDSKGSNPFTTVDVPSTPGSVPGLVAGARSFNGSQYFVHGDNADLSTGDIDFTWQVWVKLQALTDGGLIGKWQPGGFEFLLKYNPAFNINAPFLWAVDGGGTVGIVNAANFGIPTTGVWMLVHGWHDSVNNLIGISVNAGTADTTAHAAGVDDTGADINFGYQVADSLINGYLDEIAFWKRVLTPTERTYLYNGGAGRSYAELTGTPAVSTVVHQNVKCVGSYRVMW